MLRSVSPDGKQAMMKHPRVTGRKGTAAIAVLALTASGCGEEGFARSFRIDEMGQTIGGPAAIGRPGDFFLENDQIRAIVHGRHNMRSSLPIANGSLVDLDLQRPQHQFSAGRGLDAFYELGPMANLKVSSAVEMTQGTCQSVGVAPCPAAGCARVSAKGRGEHIIPLVGLLDFVIKRRFGSAQAQLITDYDVCPGEALVRISSTLRLPVDDSEVPKAGPATPMEELIAQTGLLDIFLGETTGEACTRPDDKNPAGSCPADQACEDLLLPLPVGGASTEMKRCRTAAQRQAGVAAGDFMLFSGKVSVFVPGNGFDHESHGRSLFDSGGDNFSNPLAIPFIAGVGNGVSYAYFTRAGNVQIPVFADAFTAAITHRAACPQGSPLCYHGKDLQFQRYVSVGRGDVASALAGYYRIRSIPTAELSGHVIDRRTERGLSDVDVFVFRVPRAWEQRSDQTIASSTYEELAAAARAESKSSGNPDGDVGLVSHLRTDVGYDPLKDGSFSGPLPVSPEWCRPESCRYILLTRSRERGASRLAPLTVAAGRSSRILLVAPQAATLHYEVQDASGRPLPAKLTIGHCFPECARDEDCAGRPAARTCDPMSRLCVRTGAAAEGSCRADQTWDAAARRCRCSKAGFLPLALRGQRLADGTIGVELSASGRGELQLEPGTYEVIASRGTEYEISRKLVTLQAGTVARFRAALPRVVDTTGWVSADFHVHGPNSVDSGLDHATRVRSYAAEGVELLSASDHDHLTDYGPTIRQLGLDTFLRTQTGVEVSTLDYGHFVGFPLVFDENAELNGAFHWRRCIGPKDRPGACDPSPPTTEDWVSVPPADIFKMLRALGALGPEKTVVFAAHYYDYFTYYSVDPWTSQVSDTNLAALFSKILQQFSGDFDAVEALNGKNFDIVRRPTYSEIRGYNSALEKYLAESKSLSYEERQAELLRISAEAQRQFLARTPEEQVTAIAWSNPLFSCRCTTDAQCGQPATAAAPGSICDEDRGECATTCGSNGQCHAERVAAGRESCDPKGSDAARRVCTRLPKSCASDSDCPLTFNTPARERCLAVDPAAPGAKTCELPCTSNDQCKTDPLRPACDPSRKVCGRAPATTSVTPCPTLRGSIDDWFQMLNHGVRRTILGNSDSHGTYSVEAGTPRNYVRSSTDLPKAIQPEEIAAEVHGMHSFSTFGPFVDLRIDNQVVGSVVPIKKGQSVTLSLRVQSPLWFDVDRIEIYRNGALIAVVNGRTDCAPGESCIRVPNDRVVNYQGTLADTPDRDSWYAVIAMGLDGKTLAPVYSSTPVGRLGIYELLQRLTPLLPPLRSLRIPLPPSMGVVRPYAVTNAIWVDVDGDGLTPLNPLPRWATARDRGEPGQSSSALTVEHHDHRAGLGRMARQAADLNRLLERPGAVSSEDLQRVLEMLRYLPGR